MRLLYPAAQVWKRAQRRATRRHPPPCPRHAQRRRGAAPPPPHRSRCRSPRWWGLSGPAPPQAPRARARPRQGRLPSCSYGRIAPSSRPPPQPPPPPRPLRPRWPRWVSSRLRAWRAGPWGRRGRAARSRRRRVPIARALATRPRCTHQSRTRGRSSRRALLPGGARPQAARGWLLG